MGRAPVRQQRRIEIRRGTIAITQAGSGPPLLLVHGLGGNRHTWDGLIDQLAVGHTVIAPDLPGHGESRTPSGDLSIGAHASLLRDLLLALDQDEPVTLIGHSLGGGIAMEFAYLFPEHAGRLVLIGSGGFGSEVSPFLCAVAVPGSGPLLEVLARLPRAVTRRAIQGVAAVPGLLAGQDVNALAGRLRDLADPVRRRAFLRTARGVLDWRGQTVSATRLLRMLDELPLLVIWGGQDRIIPPRHHEALVGQLRHAYSLTVPEAGHYVHETAAGQVAAGLQAFLAGTRPARFDPVRWRELLTRAGPRDAA